MIHIFVLWLDMTTIYMLSLLSDILKIAKEKRKEKETTEQYETQLAKDKNYAGLNIL